MNSSTKEGKIFRRLSTGMNPGGGEGEGVVCGGVGGEGGVCVRVWVWVELRG